MRPLQRIVFQQTVRGFRKYSTRQMYLDALGSGCPGNNQGSFCQTAVKVDEGGPIQSSLHVLRCHLLRGQGLAGGVYAGPGASCRQGRPWSQHPVMAPGAKHLLCRVASGMSTCSWHSAAWRESATKVLPQVAPSYGCTTASTSCAILPSPAHATINQAHCRMLLSRCF